MSSTTIASNFKRTEKVPALRQKVSQNKSTFEVTRRPSNVTNLARMSGLLPDNDTLDTGRIYSAKNVSQATASPHSGPSFSSRSLEESSSLCATENESKIVSGQEATEQAQSSRRSLNKIGEPELQLATSSAAASNASRLASVVNRSKSFNVSPDPQLRFYQGPETPDLHRSDITHKKNYFCIHCYCVFHCRCVSARKPRESTETDSSTGRRRQWAHRGSRRGCVERFKRRRCARWTAPDRAVSSTDSRALRSSRRSRAASCKRSSCQWTVDWRTEGFLFILF